MLVAGFVDTAVLIIGVMFLMLWITGLRLGGRIDRERAERIEAEREAAERGDADQAAGGDGA